MSNSQRQSSAFSEKKLEYFRLRLKQKGISSPEEQTITRRKEAGPYPLSFAQQRLWFLEQYEQGTSTYNIPAAIRLKGSLNLAALEQSVDEIIQRHEMLRTIFANEKGKPTQVIIPGQHVLNRIDLLNVSGDEQETLVRRLVDEEAKRPFDLSSGPLIRWHLLLLDTEEYALLFTMHHIISDGWSIEILIREMAQLYSAFEAGQPSPLPPLPIQYGDYALWQREWLQGTVLDQQLNYWRQQLRDLPILAFPTDHPRPRLQNHHGASVAFSLSQPLSEQLRRLSQQEGTTLFMTLLAAFQVLLARYCGQDDIVVGTPIANRRHRELEGLIGFFVNTLVVRSDLSGNPTFQQVLARVRQVCLEAYAHQDVPFEKLVEVLQPSRDLTRHPLFQVFFGLMPAFPDTLAAAELQIEPLTIEMGTTKFDLSLLMQEKRAGQEVMGVFEYNIELFECETIQRLVEHFKLLLEAIVEQINFSIHMLPLLTPTEEEQLVHSWNATQIAFPQKQCLHHLVEAQAHQTPDAVAVVSQESHLTYAVLNARANQLAHYLQAKGVGPEVLVGVYLERSLELVISLLAILKAGGAYVPLDPAYPEERLRFLMQDAHVPLVLTREAGPSWLTETEGRPLSLEQIWFELDEYPITNVQSLFSPQQLAYVIYTSGSTGQPKGAMNQHGSLCNRLQWMQQVYQLTPADRILQKTPVSFDVSVWEFFWPLCFGAGLVMAPPGAHQDPRLLVQLILQYDISVLHFVPSMLHAFLEISRAETNEVLRHVICSGEALSPTLQEHFFALHKTQLHNLYGPTEAAIDVTAWTCVPGQEQSCVPIGRPIANTQIYLLSTTFQPVPLGVVGELYIGGVGVGRGYWQRPDLTAERFLPDPFSGTSGARLYRSGDLARYRSDGSLEFVGRVDSQIKLRGFRIELGEIEAALRGQPGVAEAVVLLREDRAADPRLVAYVVPLPLQEGIAQPSLSELRHRISQWLPDYMLPNHLVLLERWPLTPNGKLDRKALPPPDRRSSQREQTYVAPGSPMEELLVGLWQEILGVEQVGIEDNFFELGGHSLLATQLVSRLRSILVREVPLKLLFAQLTVSTLARELELLLQNEDEGANRLLPLLLPRKRQATIPLSFAQERLWFLAQLVPENPFYNMPMALRLKGDLQEAALSQSINELVARHEVLRTTFPALQGAPVQSLISSLPTNLPVIDLQDLSVAQQEAQVHDLGMQEALRPFNLTTDPPFRVFLLRLSLRTHILLLTLHHIIADGWSLQVLTADLSALYSAFEAGQPSPLPPLPIQYGDYALWQREWLQGTVLDQQLNYWRQQLRDLPILAFPTDHPRPRLQNHHGASVAFSLSQPLSEQLRRLSQQEGTTLFMTLLAAFQVLLARYCGQDDIVVGTPIANRRHRELERLIGFFVNMLVVRSDLSGNPTFQQVLARVRQVCLEAYAHQDVPFEKLVEVLQPSRDLTRHPLFQISFQLLQSQQGPEPNFSFPRLHLTTEKVEGHVARFDMEIDLYENQQKIEGYLLYNTNLFEPESINRLLQHWHTLLEAIVAHPEQQLWQLPLLTPTEEEQLVHSWNATQIAFPQKQCLHHLVEAQAHQTPDAVAVVSQESHLTYAALNARANQLAHYLQAKGVGPEVLVGVYLERSLELVISLLAILKAGGAYVPLDPAYPEERLRFLMQDAHVPLVLTREAGPSWLKETALQSLSLEQIWSELDQYPITTVQSMTSPQQLAYVIYTSGSTGQPKGVQVTHSNLMYSTLARAQYYREPVKSFLLLSSFAFDSSVAGIFWTLYQGGRLILPSLDQVHDACALSQLIVHQQISHLLTVPSFYRLLLTQKELRQADSLQVSIVAGEACSGALVKQHYDCLPYTAIFNEYGPTEATVWCSVHDPENDEAGAEVVVPIGRPIANTQIYLLSTTFQPVPLGVVGELYIGGVGVGRGYWQRPDLTAERFLPDPFSGTSGARLYRSGDLARYRSDGSLEFVGRVDSQIKLRGFRIELGEIEAALRGQPGVAEAVVLLREDRAADPRLVAYIVPTVPDQSTLSTREYLLKPSYWQTVFEETYRSSRLSQVQSHTFDTTGWISSYTHISLTTEEMAEWVEQTVTRITALQPQRILEIGCGTGLLLFRLLSRVQAYWGTDFSAQAIQSLQGQLAEQTPSFAHLRLEQRAADNWTGLPHDFFDMVILNSVVQYFPDLDYLIQVLEQAVNYLQVGGVIFVGDVRSLPLLEAFHTSVVLHQASASLHVAEARELIRQRMQQEEELVIDPCFFDWLPQRLPQIQRVHLSPRRGQAVNELTQFRYDVVLEIAAPQTSNINMIASRANEGTNPLKDVVWSEIGSLQQIAQMLEDQQFPQVSLSHVPNRRVQSVVRACQILQAADPEQRVLDVLSRFGLPEADEQGIDPEELWALGQRSGYQVEISWSGHDKTGAYDVLFWRKAMQETEEAEQKQRYWKVLQKVKEPLSWVDYATKPWLAQERRALVSRLRQRLGEQLPAYMLPATFLLLERLPLTPNGKLDRRALPSPQDRLALKQNYVAPRDSLEKLLVGIWQEALGREHIGCEDHFFELGGHSLLAIQVVARARQAGLHLTLSSLFQYPIVADLATFIRGEPLLQPSREPYTHLGATREPDLEKRAEHRHKALVGLQPSGLKPPFFCIPPISGEPMCYAALAQAMGDDYPLYGLRAAGLQGEREPFTSIQEMAAYYVEAIRTHDPDGPYAFGGWSFGGLVAFEMALQLQRQGARVALLALIDTFAPPFSRHKLTQGEMAEMSTFLAENLLQSLSHIPEQERLQPLQVQNLRTLPPLEQVQYLQRLAEVAGVDDFIRVGQANFLAMERYQPKELYEGCLLLLRASTKTRQTMLDATYGWKQLTSLPVEVQVVPGTHDTLISDPYVFALAQHLQTYLDDTFRHVQEIR